MTVYVDNARIPTRVDNIRSYWSHLTADTKEELHIFAQSIGLKREWFQTCVKGRKFCPPETCPHWHYDVTEAKRKLAIVRGAEPIDMYKMGELIIARREAGK